MASSSRRSWSSAANYLVGPRDFWVLIAGGKTDARIAELEAGRGRQAALEALYGESDDPWDTLNPRFNYQSRKYNTAMTLLPPRQFRRALDLGCGLGTLSRLLASRADAVVGIDVAQSAVKRARTCHSDLGNVHFQQGDVAGLPGGLEAASISSPSWTRFTICPAPAIQNWMMSPNAFAGFWNRAA